MLDLLYSKTNIWDWMLPGKTARLFLLFPVPSSLNEQTHGQGMSSQDDLAVILEKRAIINKVAYWLKRSNKSWLVHSNGNLRVNIDLNKHVKKMFWSSLIHHAFKAEKNSEKFNKNLFKRSLLHHKSQNVSAVCKASKFEMWIGSQYPC